MSLEAIRFHRDPLDYLSTITKTSLIHIANQKNFRIQLGPVQMMGASFFNVISYVKCVLGVGMWNLSPSKQSKSWHGMYERTRHIPKFKLNITETILN